MNSAIEPAWFRMRRVESLSPKYTDDRGTTAGSKRAGSLTSRADGPARGGRLPHAPRLATPRVFWRFHFQV
jgi:hypothetical protein